MSVFQSLLLGLIQGLGEFLPISSSGHLLLARLFLGIQTDSPALKMLDILLHVGTLIPVIIVFWKEWVNMILHPIRNKALSLLIVASIPTLFVYLLAKKTIVISDMEGFAVFDSGWFLGSSFIISALFLLLCDLFAKRSAGRPGASIGYLHAIVMGLFQGIGMIPGVSRSGSTILGGVSTGLDKNTAARFSFMMSAPAILGSLLMEGKEAIEKEYIKELSLFPALVGVIVAAAVGYLAIRFMLKAITRTPLSWFALYLGIIGITFLVLQLTGNPLVPSFSLPSSVPVL